ncbi:MAG: hypothetical protein KDA46_12035 [Parvularculaceae bacterium]|nr:hypothetical protein [Parvularculaceae bacterium]
MILRRFIEHVKAQNWTAVALDFLIVVVGVLMAFQITAWHESRIEHQRSEDFLARIRTDLEGDVSELTRHREFWNDVADQGAAAVRFAETGARGEASDRASDWELMRAFLHATQHWQFTFIDTTYAELRSAGELGLIRDIDMRRALADYYVSVASRRGGDGPYQLNPAYRVMARGRIRSDILQYYWSACFRQAAGVQELVDCPPPPNVADIGDVLAKFAADEELLNALRYWVHTLALASELTAFDLQRAARLIELIDAQS